MLLNQKWELELPDYRAEQWEIWNKHSGWERNRIQGIMDRIKYGTLVVDIGSEQGDYPALWATRGADVIIVEANPLFWPGIRKIWEMNHESHEPVGCFVGFIGNENYEAGVYDGWPAETRRKLEPNPGFYHLNEHEGIPTITLDGLMSIHAEAFSAAKNVIVSIDIEGSELEALKGAEQLLEKGIEFFVSVHPDFMIDRYDQTREDLLDFMEAHGYRQELLAVDHEEHWRFTK